jgi:hypothetical protein
VLSPPPKAIIVLATILASREKSLILLFPSLHGTAIPKAHIVGAFLLTTSAAGLPARVQIPVSPSATSRLLYELLGRVRMGFLVVSPFRLACAFLHVEQGRGSK